jgi:DNA-directed RNA polymerase specialized sigma24 family protein
VVAVTRSTTFAGPHQRQARAILVRDKRASDCARRSLTRLTLPLAAVALFKGGEYSTAELADLFGVARTAVYRVCQRERARVDVGIGTAG